jgi:hypothetical protein
MTGHLVSGRVRVVAPSVCIAFSMLLGGCAGLNDWQRAGVTAGVVTLGMSPSADVSQTYYLGSFDPQEQLPPAVYRIRVRGQSSILNATRFASSWVPAEVVDSLNGNIAIDNSDGDVTYSPVTTGPTAKPLLSGRGLVLFGPEGFREAPRNHRLVVIMGSSPEKVEQAFASALGTVAQAKFGDTAVNLDRQMFQRLTTLHGEKERLRTLLQSP